MTVQNIYDMNFFESVCIPEPEREIGKVFCCDLLSIAMSRAPADSVWVTVMSNVNTLAVGSLADVSLIVIAEDVEVADELKEKAAMQHINIMRTGLPVFEAALKVREVLQ